MAASCGAGGRHGVNNAACLRCEFRSGDAGKHSRDAHASGLPWESCLHRNSRSCLQLLGNSAAGSNRALATAVIVMVFTMALYNILAVIVLQASKHPRTAPIGGDRRSDSQQSASPRRSARPGRPALANYIAFFPAASPRSTRRCRSADRIDVHRRFVGNDKVARATFVDRYGCTPESGRVACSCFPLDAAGGTRTRRSAHRPRFSVLSNRRGSIRYGTSNGRRRSTCLRFDRPQHFAFFISLSVALWVTS